MSEWEALDFKCEECYTTAVIHMKFTTETKAWWIGHHSKGHILNVVFPPGETAWLGDGIGGLVSDGLGVYINGVYAGPTDMAPA
jgi:hypothetical protein